MVYSADSTGKPTLCIIGAGFSGICAAIQLKKQIPSMEFTLFDENDQVGGTWYNNTYPGCAPDIGSHLYSYSFEPNPNWTHSYSPQQEVLEYLKDIANKYELYSRTKFNHTVNRLIWDDNKLGWRVNILNKKNNQRQELFFNFVITAHGRFHSPKIPEEFQNFQGPMMHSAQWNNEIDLKDKIVAVIGSASSAAQIIPNIAGKVKRLLVYQRHATWVVPRYQFQFPQIAKWAFSNLPAARWAYRTYLYWLYQMGAPCFRPGTVANKFAKLLAKFHLWRQVNDPKVLILATGFRVQDSFGSMEIIGKNGENLFTSWLQDRPRTYLSLMNSNAPNLFILLGPNTAIGYTSILFPLECQVHWVVTLLKELDENDWRYVGAKRCAEAKYMKELDGRLQNTIIGSGSCGDCNTWYLNPRGRVTELFPGTTKAFWDNTQQVQLIDLELF